METLQCLRGRCELCDSDEDVGTETAEVTLDLPQAGYPTLFWTCPAAALCLPSMRAKLEGKLSSGFALVSLGSSVLAGLTWPVSV